MSEQNPDTSKPEQEKPKWSAGWRSRPRCPNPSRARSCSRARRT